MLPRGLESVFRTQLGCRLQIDCAAIVDMQDAQLKLYLSAYGDRIAVMAFAKANTKSSSNAEQAEGKA